MWNATNCTGFYYVDEIGTVLNPRLQVPMSVSCNLLFSCCLDGSILKPFSGSSGSDAGGDSSVGSGFHR